MRGLDCKLVKANTQTHKHARTANTNAKAGLVRVAGAGLNPENPAVLADLDNNRNSKAQQNSAIYRQLKPIVLGAHSNSNPAN